MNTNEGGANIAKQEEILLQYMRTHKSVTRATGMSKLGIANIPEIVRRLRERGHTIEGEWVERIKDNGAKKRFKRYTLIKEAV